jgi:hypothetical protein
MLPHRDQAGPSGHEGMALTVSQRLTAVLDNPPPFAADERAGGQTFDDAVG